MIFNIYSTMVTTMLLIFVIITLVIQVSSSDTKNLQCYATLSPQNELICPEDRMNFCIKEEVIGISRKNCGATALHPFDVWDVKSKSCVYKKCGGSCSNETIEVKGIDGEYYNRSTSCCTTKLCNSANSLVGKSLVIAFLQISLVVALLIF
jgi:hypothetical protein